MSVSTEKSAPLAKATTAVKKRTIYKERSMLEFPQWAKDDKTHKFRWVSKRRVSRSDGFDARGWSTARDPKDNSTLEAHDLILHKMPIEEWEAMKEYKDAATRRSLTDVLEGIESQQDRLRYEVEKLGGRLSKTDFTIERKA